MKFTKEEFSEKLKNKLTNNGKKPMQQSERTFKKLVEKIYARLEKMDDDDTELDDAVADYLEDFEEIEGNLNKDKAIRLSRAKLPNTPNYISLGCSKSLLETSEWLYNLAFNVTQIHVHTTKLIIQTYL